MLKFNYEKFPLIYIRFDIAFQYPYSSPNLGNNEKTFFSFSSNFYV